MAETDEEKDMAFIDAVEASLGSLVPQDLYALARRGAEAEAEIDRLRATIENVKQAAAETHSSWEARCYAMMAMLDTAALEGCDG
jgi:hypothetical protein